MSDIPEIATPPPDTPEPQAQVQARDVSSNITSIGGTVDVAQHIDAVYEFFGDDGDGRGTAARRFAESDACDISDEREEELKALYVGNPEKTENLVTLLDRERILVLTGERGIGKQTTALYAATRVADAHHLVRSTALIGPLDARIRVDLRKITEDEKFGRRVIVFDDALANGNISLTDALGRLERATCDRITGNLVRLGSYLVITAASAEFVPFQRHVGGLLTVRQLTGELLPEIAYDGYARKLGWISTAAPEKAAHIEQLAANRDRILKRLGTFARTASFVDFFVKRGDIDLDAALEDYTDGARWFRTSLASDFDAWCGALSLVLSQAAPVSGEVAWVDCERLRRTISDRMKSDEELFPSWRNRERARAPRGSGESLDDEALRAAAQIELVASDSGHIVRFNDAVNAPELWESLLTDHHRVLSLVLPVLRTLAEQDRAAERLSLRALAARAVGRIGEIDPDRIVRPLVRHWGSSQQFGHLVGRLLQGVLASKNPKYRESAWAHIDSLVDFDSEKPATQLLTAVAAYAQAASYDSSRALRELGNIVAQMAPSIETHHQAVRRADMVARTAAKARSKKRVQALRQSRDRLAKLADAIEEKYKSALAATGKAIAYIAYDDVVGTLTAMRDWLSEGGHVTGTAVAILFLQFIANELTDQDPWANPLLLSLTVGGRRAVSDVAAFLADVYTEVHRTFALPADTQRELAAEFTDCIGAWARAAVEGKIARAEVEDLFVVLAAVRGGLMREEIYTLLGSSAFADDDTMRPFALAVRKRLDH